MNTMTQLIAAGTLLLAGYADPQEKGGESDIRDSVVKVLATQHPPDLDRPFAKQPAREVSGSGFVIEGNRILTSAHVVLYASSVVVQPHPSGDKLSATVVGLAPSIDLAILKLEDEAFFKTRTPLKTGGPIPKLQESVSVHGYPIGGDGQSITKGIVSRIEFSETHRVPAPFPLHLDTYLEPCLRIQIDAALNAGNSGGPALVNDRVVGVVQATLAGAQKIGYLIANEEVEGFLKDVADGMYPGKLRVFDEWQPLENRSLRAKLGAGSETTGVVVRVPWSSEPGYALKESDVISRIGDYEIDNAGMARGDGNLRLRWDYLVSKLSRENAVPLTVFRGGKTLEISLPVGRDRKLLLPSLKGRYPSYFVYGPLVFSAATADYVDVSGPLWWAVWSHVNSPLITRRHARVEFDGQELVVLAAQLPHRISQGYSSRYTQVVTHVNDVRIRNLRHLVETLRDANEGYMTFRFADAQAETITFSRKELLAATEKILDDNGIRQQGSDDLLAIWKERP